MDSPSVTEPANASRDAIVTEPESVFDVLLELLLHLAQIPNGILPESQMANVRTATEQRLRELLWRDLEQGHNWQHLSSSSGGGGGGGSNDSHWKQRRPHVFGLVVGLAAPLRAHAVAIKEGGERYSAGLAEVLVPMAQAVLRTYRHSLAVDLAPPCPTDPLASPVAWSRYGQQTVLTGQLGGVDCPAWLSPSADPHKFVTTALPQWAALLDTPPLANALNAHAATSQRHATDAVATVSAWGDAVELQMAAAASEDFHASSAANAAAGFAARLRKAEGKRAARRTPRRAAAVAQAAHAWEGRGAGAAARAGGLGAAGLVWRRSLLGAPGGGGCVASPAAARPEPGRHRPRRCLRHTAVERRVAQTERHWR